MKKKLLLLSLLSVLLFSQSTAAHPGRTDSNGGHYDRSTGEYHYHTGEYAGRVSSGSSDSSAENKIEKPVKENKAKTAPTAQKPKENTAHTKNKIAHFLSPFKECIIFFFVVAVFCLIFIILFKGSFSEYLILFVIASFILYALYAVWYRGIFKDLVFVPIVFQVIFVFLCLKDRCFNKENKLHVISPFYALVLKNSDIIKNKLTAASVIFAVLLVSIFTTNSFILSRLGIYSLNFERTGSFCYYVKAQNLSTKKTYTLPASVYVDIPTGEKTYREFTIEELFFSNGNSIDLDHDRLEIEFAHFPHFSISHSLKKPIVLEASGYNYGNNSEWKCTLTNRHVDNPPFEETSRKKAIPSLLIYSLTLLYVHITTVYAIKSDLHNT